MKKILVVDDEKSIRITFSKFLSNYGYKVKDAENVEKALEVISTFEPDVVITDIIMPHFSGMTLLQKIKEINPELPVIVMTGEPSVDTASEAVRNQAFDYIFKPVNKNSLMHIVGRAIEYKKLSEEKKVLEKENEKYRNNLEKLVVKRTKALSNAVSATISTISSMLELRDPYTAGHNRGVGNLSADIAEKLGLKKSVSTALLIAGYLHDIGKISIPSEILSKPGRITDLEFQIIKTHAEKSYEILSKANLDWNIADIVYNHHERLDGSGYPRGISGDNLNIESRILMASDVVEAMLSHRPYRPSLNIEIVLEELKKDSGAKYDKKIVAAIEEMFCMDGYRISQENLMKEALFEF